MTLTKRELVIEVASVVGSTQNEVAAVVQTTLDTIADTLTAGDRVEIRNFGVFEIKERDARVGRNPRTGEEVPISRKRIASFKSGKVLKEWVQRGKAIAADRSYKRRNVSNNRQYGEKADMPGTESPTDEPSTADALDNRSESVAPGSQQTLF